MISQDLSLEKHLCSFSCGFGYYGLSAGFVFPWLPLSLLPLHVPCLSCLLFPPLAPVSQGLDIYYACYYFGMLNCG